MFKKVFGVILILIGLAFGWLGLQVIVIKPFNAIQAFLIGFLFLEGGISIIDGDKIWEVIRDLFIYMP